MSEPPELVIPKLEPGETVGPFTITIPADVVEFLDYVHRLPRFRRWAWSVSWLPGLGWLGTWAIRRRL